MSDKVDFRKTLKNLYNPPKGPFQIVDIPTMNFLAIDGTGNPNTSSDYKEAIEAVYSMAYGIKFAVKPLGYEYVIPPMEGLWWMENMEEFTQANKDRWEWTMMIMQPDWVNGEIVEKVRANTIKKKGNPKLEKIRFEAYHEGLSVQTLYIGAYSDEGPTIEEMHRFIHNKGFLMNGKHHEIYLADQRKTAAAKLKTILRQPVRI